MGCCFEFWHSRGLLTEGRVTDVAYIQMLHNYFRLLFGPGGWGVSLDDLKVSTGRCCTNYALAVRQCVDYVYNKKLSVRLWSPVVTPVPV